jgi:hypothetical protein
MSAIFETEFRDLQDGEGNTTKASTAKIVLLALADHANDEGEGAYPGLTRMERKTALSRQAIINTYQTLKYNGIIYLVGTSRKNTNNYSINTASFPRASADSQPGLLVNPVDSGSQPGLPEVVNRVDPNHPLTINEPSPQNPKKTDETPGEYKPDLVDLELSKLPALSIRKAIHEYFRLNVNWDTKYSRQWLEWAHEENITAEQIARAADAWRTDRLFNWQPPTLKGIFEKWQLLMDASTPATPQQTDGKGFYA